MDLETAKRVLWEHFTYEYWECYLEQMDDEDREEMIAGGYESEKDYVVDCYNWMPQGLLQDWDGESTNSVEYACVVYVGSDTHSWTLAHHGMWEDYPYGTDYHKANNYPVYELVKE